MRVNKKLSNKEWKKQLLKRLLEFSVRIIKLAEKLPKTPAGFAVASQLIKAGTSIGANAEEAQDANSLKDFVHKMGISLRESKETRYWLKVIKLANLIEPNYVSLELAECEEIVAILTSSVKSSREKL
ncbi:hypothetical protein A3J17_05100 [Candidatus Curtissbacteria bacterium RIFCSPLOWO2_02_FULL_40_11]|uniref:Four helix bundle protein n=2 Tax=Candidatus Curtissiibacteriota TaxID=1752717 RepID=A0A1F5G8F8_9BACT|nr:MAG: hypothetical protein A2775_00125 [Candidatus Curtissbacteria bacterium RIFCSPHIGHO2_01_FULL_39_57]OGD88129.1 MAG: hypothetical protein A3D04_01515 [Candidatus Curtissbacteria bacterium RIFCSPHIGHO2_02_FULL_40_16b]OGE00511.1 MAG: hypothetical protein A3J17_05100 [Candidatus Curtissbacteria bacterium RIFCSPLOWO2_02_FULL_40_11]OGE13236.1 MAG: hypothetical protein A3G14_00485 [Candidatus Curtissbacteria bacterium RIFCSPLOWO2_12_FULL_38_9]